GRARCPPRRPHHRDRHVPGLESVGRHDPRRDTSDPVQPGEARRAPSGIAGGLLMVARVKHEPDALAVTLHRDGEAMIRTAAADGDKAMLQAVTLLLAAKTLRAGDRLTVESANDPHN